MDNPWIVCSIQYSVLIVHWFVVCMFVHVVCDCLLYSISFWLGVDLFVVCYFCLLYYLFIVVCVCDYLKKIYCCLLLAHLRVLILFSHFITESLLFRITDTRTGRWGVFSPPVEAYYIASNFQNGFEGQKPRPYQPYLHNQICWRPFQVFATQLKWSLLGSTEKISICTSYFKIIGIEWRMD